MAETALVLRRFGGRCINVFGSDNDDQRSGGKRPAAEGRGHRRGKGGGGRRGCGGQGGHRGGGQKGRVELAELRAKSDEKAREDARQLASDTENKKAAMRARADARLGKAAALIVERVVNG